MRTHPVHLPHFRLHAPHVGWHHIEHPLRGLTLAVGIPTALLAGWMLFNRLPAELPAISLPSLSLPEAATPEWGRELPREWRWERQAVSFEHMVRPGAEGAPSLAGMYRTQR